MGSRGDVAVHYANLCALVFDYVARQKIGGTHTTYGLLNQLPVFPPGTSTAVTLGLWEGKHAMQDWIGSRVLELTCTAHDLAPFARDLGYDGPPFRWDPARRFLLRCELDAAFFQLYGISRDDADYILDTFHIVKRDDLKAYGDYRTKRVILEIYDAIQESLRTGQTYKTRLDPPPADPRCCHASNEVSR